MKQNESHRREVEYLIIGAGPAGLQLAYFLQRRGRDCLLLEATDRPGAFFERFPRHGKLISVNKVHTGYDDIASQLRYDWNSLISDDPELLFSKYTSDYFPDSKLYVKYLQDFAERFELPIQYGTAVSQIRPAAGSEANGSGWNYIVTDASGQEYACRALIIATGVNRPYIPNIPGIEHAENYWDCSIDPKDFTDQRLLIIGKSNSAFETADHLVEATRATHLCSPNSVKMAWKTHYVGNLRAVNNNFLDTYLLKGQNSVLDATIDRIEKVDDEFHVDITFTHAKGQRAQLAYDRIIACTGFAWKPTFFGGGCEPEMSACGRLPAMTSAWESTNLPNLFYAGTLMQMRDMHKTMSNVLHGFRSNIYSLSSILGERFENTTWPHTRLQRCPEALADKVIERVSTDASIMLQPGFLADVLVVDDEGAAYYETASVEYVHESHFGKNPHYYTITMEYGDSMDDPLSIQRAPDPSQAQNDYYLHPRIQRFQGRLNVNDNGQAMPHKVAEHHISESLENEWRPNKHPGARPLIRKIDLQGQEDSTQFQQTHREKLVAFFRSQLDSPATNGQSQVQELSATVGK